MEHGTGSRPDRAPLRERISAQSNDGDPMTDPGGGKTADGSARWRPSALPLALLFLALATVFLFGGGRGHFYHERGHDHITWNHMTVAENLSPEHDFLGFYYLTLDDDGDLTYYPYNRFPVLGHVLIKLATLPFPDDLSARLSAARMLMLAFFAAAGGARAVRILLGVRHALPIPYPVRRHVQRRPPPRDFRADAAASRSMARGPRQVWGRVTRDGGRLRVFLHVRPSDANDLPTGRRRFGFDALLNDRSANVLSG